MKLTKLSASRIKTYKMCPFKYYLQYERKIDSPPNFGALQGSAVHEVLEGLAKPRCQNPQEKDEIIDKINTKNWKKYLAKKYRDDKIWTYDKKAKAKACDGCRYNKNENCAIAKISVNDIQKCPKRGFEDAVDLVYQIIKDKGPVSPFNKKILDVERYFDIEIKDGEDIFSVCGYFDIVSEIDDETVEIMDYKTGSWIQPYHDCKRDPQFLIYHLAATVLYPEYSTILVTPYYMRKDALTLVFDKKDDQRTIKALVKYWHFITNDRCPKRRCDKRNGVVNFDWKCKALCDPEKCAEEYERFIENGGVVDE